MTFAYPGAGQDALASVNLDIPAGSTLALVGETGSGKTTLGALIARLYDPSSGSVRIDGIDLRDLRLTDLAHLAGVVSQETYLLHTTVRENLRYAKPDATDAEIEAAPRSPSRTGCPPCATPARLPSWTTARSSRRDAHQPAGWPGPVRCPGRLSRRSSY